MKCLLLFSLLSFAIYCPALSQTLASSETMYRVALDNYDVNSTRMWENDTVRYRYNQMKYYVKTILPYLKEATAIFNELNAKLNDPSLTGKTRHEYVRAKEQVVRSHFEDQIKALNETQGVLLIKLCARQTGLNIYHQLSEFKGGFAALKWQAWARVHGFNLNRRYHPEEEPDMEHIMRSLGYPLPPYYGGSAEDGY